MALPVSDAPVRRPYTPPPPPPPPAPRKEVDPAVRQPALHQGKTDAPPPERYVQHEVERGENLTEISRRYRTTVPMLEAANPQIKNPDAIEIGQKVNAPIGADYGREPTRDVVEPGQTLTDMARQHAGVSAQDIARANRHEIPNADRIHAGQEVWVPADRPATPLEQKVQATDAAVANVDRAQQAYDTLEPGTNRAIRDEMYEGIQSAKGNLKTAVQAEVDERVKTIQPAGGKPAEADYAAAGNQVKDRYQSDPAATQKLDTALKSLADDRYRASPQGQAEAIVSKARGAGDAPKQVASLNNSLKTAPPKVRDAVMNSAQGKQLIQDAAQWATDPLAGGDAIKADENARQEFGGAGQQVPGGKTMERLERLTRDLDPALAAQLTSQAMPTVEKYLGDFQAQFGGQPLGPSGMANMLKVLDRGVDTPAGQANIERMAKLGVYDRDALRLHVSGGGSPAYAIALSRQPGIDSATVLQQAYDGVAAYRAQITETAKDYSVHMEELGWLVQNHGASMTPEQLQKAIADYTAEKNKSEPGWEAKGKALQDKLAEQGATLQTQLDALRALPAGTPGRDDAIAGALNDPAVGLALNTAWEKKPELLQGAKGDGLLGFFADPTVKGSAKLTDTGRKLFTDVATQYMKHNVAGALETFNPADPASVAATREAVGTLRNSRLAAVLGVSPKEMDAAVQALETAMPEAGESADDIARKMSTLNGELDEIGEAVRGRLGFDPADAHRGMKAFDKSTVAGQAIRGLGMLLSGVGLLASTGTAMSDPSLKNWLKSAGDGLGLTQKGLELAVGMGKINEGSLLGKAGASLVGRVLGAGMAVFDVWSAVESAQQGDYTSAGLYGAGAVGGVTAALFTGPIGWAGLAVVGISAAGLWVWNGVKESRKHEPDSDGGTAMRFLQHAGLNESAARALTDQSGDGHSVMPLLNRYAELKGMKLDDPAQQKKFIDWINGMQPEQLAALRDNLHETADDIDGDPAKFNATADGDRYVVPDIADRPWFTRMGDHGPASVAQLEAQLQVLQIPVLG